MKVSFRYKSSYYRLLSLFIDDIQSFDSVDNIVTIGFNSEVVASEFAYAYANWRE